MKKVMMEKWLSLANHIHNVHEHPGHRHFPACLNSALGDERRIKWIKEGTKLSVNLLDILQSKHLLKDIRMLSTGPQTAALESFHSLLNHFCPKMIGFFFGGMFCRTVLAALHFNENTMHKQTVTKDGKERHKLSFKKSKNDFTVVKVKDDPTFGYVDILKKEGLQLASDNSLTEMLELAKQWDLNLPPPLCSSFEKPNKEDAVQSFQTRYGKKLH